MTACDKVKGIYCVGLTGGIGCGKSTVAELFQAHGALLIDTDEIAHQLTASGGAAMARIREEFGANYLSDEGALNRVKMRELIFSDAHAKQQLEAVLHPLILAGVQQKLSQNVAAVYALIVVPLLLQSPSFQKMVQRVLLVDCDEQQQIERVMRRSQLSEEAVRNIMRQQSTREQQLASADDVIHNNGDVRDLLLQVAKLHQQYFLAERQIGN